MSDQSIGFEVTYHYSYNTTIQFDDDLFKLEEWNEMDDDERMSYLVERFDTALENENQPTNYEAPLTMLHGQNGKQYTLIEVSIMNTSELILRGIVRNG